MQRHNTAQLATCLPTSLLLIIQIALLAEHVAWIGRLPDTIGIGHRVLTNMATPAVRMQSQSSCACVVLTASPYSSADLLLPCFGIDFFGTDGRWHQPSFSSSWRQAWSIRERSARLKTPSRRTDSGSH
ncbi:hypothetical protein D3C78_634680 [compost metagenome]